MQTGRSIVPETDRGAKVRLSIGPLFPRLLAAYVGIVVIIMFWGMVFASPNRYEPASYASYLFGLCLLMFLFLPRHGTIEIDAREGTLTFRESIVAGALHFWRGRKHHRFRLVPGSKVQFGSWMKEGGFVVFGLQISLPGQDGTLVFDDFQMPPSMANILIRELTPIHGVGVFPVRISHEYQTVEWRPEDKPESYSGMIAFGYVSLLFAGMIFAIMGIAVAPLIMLGLTAVGLYAAFRTFMAVKTNAHTGDGKAFTTVNIAFSVLHFSLLYAVLTFIGIEIAGGQP